jgi:hypothetical protein
MRGGAGGIGYGVGRSGACCVCVRRVVEVSLVKEVLV